MAAAKEHKDLSKETLTARLRDASKAPVAFVFALSKKSKDHYLVLHKIKAGKSLLTFVRGKQPDAGKAAYGTATLTPTALVLDCEKELPGIVTAAKAWVASNKHPKVKKIKVMVGGKELAEEGQEGEGEGEDGALEQTLAKIKSAVVGKVKDAIGAAAPEVGDKMKKLLAAANKREKGGDLKGALECYKGLAGLMKSSGGGAPTGALPKAWAEAKTAWRDASDEVNSQLSRFVGALKKSGDEELEEIGNVTDFGINALTNNIRVPLMAALVDVDRSSADSRGAAVQKAQKQVARFRKHVATDPKIGLIDENDLTKVSIRATLGAALGKLADALKTIAAT